MSRANAFGNVKSGRDAGFAAKWELGLLEGSSKLLITMGKP